MNTVHPCTDQSVWDDYILQHAGHPLQLWGWGEVKSKHGWKAARVFVTSGDQIIGASQLLIRTLPVPFKALVYAPRGPVVEQQADRGVVMDVLADYAQSKYSAVAITIEPDWATIPDISGWTQADNTILIPRTLILDLGDTEEQLLSAMAKKTRQYVRKSTAESINVRRVTSDAEIIKCLEIYRLTAQRAGFALHSNSYYMDIFHDMGDHSPVFAAFDGDQPIAFLWLAISLETAFELYGGMNDDGQRLRANYALKWKTIQTMREWGVACYDMNGLLNDGVSTFKQSFADHEDMLVGTYDKALSPLYPLWSKGLPVAKKIVQKIKNR